MSSACSTSSFNELVNGRLAEMASLVREARIDYVEIDRPRRLEFGGKLTITQWTRFPIYEIADFRRGRLVYAGPIDLTPTS
ncbi:hypothetical protein LINPERPRIM_LOCUS29314 [Linum perenne]